MSSLAITRVGIIGTGGISVLQVPGYVGVENAKVEAVCDINRAAAELRAREWNCKKIYTDYHDVLKDPQIDAVELLLPHQLHKEVVIAAAESGKHVSVMKPMALDASEAKEMISAARKANVVLNISENYLFYEPISKAIELIQSGEFGAPLTIRMERVPAMGGDERYSGGNEPDSWRWDKKKSGGMVFDDMVHYDAVARFLMQSDIESISALLDKPDQSFEIPAVVMWKHKAEQRYGDLTYSWILQAKIPSDYYGLHESIEVICEQGIIWIPNISAKLMSEAPLLAYRDGKMTAYTDLNPDYANSFHREVQHFVDSIQKGTKPMFDGEQGLKQVLFAGAIQKSADESRVVKLSELGSV